MTQTPMHPDQLQTLFDGIRQNAATHAARVHAAGARYAAAREATDAAIRGLGGPLRGLGRPTAIVAAGVAVGALAYAATKYLRGAPSQLTDASPWADRVLHARTNPTHQRDDYFPR